jgi:DNA repair protein RadC
MPHTTRMHPTAFSAQDRAVFEAISCRAPWRRVMRRPFGGSYTHYRDTLAVLLRPSEREAVRGPADAVAFLMLQLGHLDQERLCVLCLNTRNRIQKLHTVYVGSLNTSIIRVGEVFKEPLRLNSASIILVHNHPSSLVDPSPEDILITRQIVEAGKLLETDVLDHLIVGQGRWVSLREKGLGFDKK